MGKGEVPVTLSISLMTSNRRDTIRRCLDSLSQLRAKVSCELVIVDTGCDEEMRSIIESYADKIVTFPWCDDFAAARNAGLMECSGEWFLFLDDDEWFENTDAIELFFVSGEYRRYQRASYRIRNYFDTDGKTYKDNVIYRMARRTDKTEFQGRIHELLVPLEGDEILLDSMVHHYGYAYRTEEERVRHSYRNISLLQKQLLEDSWNLRNRIHLANEYYVADEYLMLAQICEDTLKQMDKEPGLDHRLYRAGFSCGWLLAMLGMRQHEAVFERCLLWEKDDWSKQSHITIIYCKAIASYYLQSKENTQKCIELYNREIAEYDTHVKEYEKEWVQMTDVAVQTSQREFIQQLDAYNQKGWVVQAEEEQEQEKKYHRLLELKAENGSDACKEYATLLYMTDERCMQEEYCKNVIQNQRNRYFSLGYFDAIYTQCRYETYLELVENDEETNIFSPADWIMLYCEACLSAARLGKNELAHQYGEAYLQAYAQHVEEVEEENIFLRAAVREGIYHRIKGIVEEVQTQMAQAEMMALAKSIMLEVYKIIQHGDLSTARTVMGQLIQMMPDLAYQLICDEIKENPENYELYICLGYYYESRNKNQAYLCYENAHYLCKQKDSGQKEHAELIKGLMNQLKDDPMVCVQPASFVILSWNTRKMTKACIDSIHRTCSPDAYEIVLIDNASTDGSANYVRGLDGECTVATNAENKGFSGGCNQGIALAKKENDIFFLNSDTEMMPNALFLMRLGLYEDDKIGAVGAMSNCVSNYQKVPEEINTLEDGYRFARRFNLPKAGAVEQKDYLVGFAVLVRRSVIDEIGGMDEDYGLGNFEDNDFGVRIIKSGHQNVLLHNVFIFHWGSESFRSNKVDFNKSLQKNTDIFRNKWGISPTYYGISRGELIDYFPDDKTLPLEILELGCGTGGTLCQLDYLYPNATVHGLEIVPEAAAMGLVKCDIRLCDVERDEIPYPKHSMDYIILADVLEHLRDTDASLERIKEYLKPHGKLVVSLPNIMNAHVIYDLLHGTFRYMDAGILDRTHLKFFTAEQIHELMDVHGFAIHKMDYTLIESESTRAPEYKDFFDSLLSISGMPERTLFDAYQYTFCAELK